VCKLSNNLSDGIKLETCSHYCFESVENITLSICLDPIQASNVQTTNGLPPSILIFLFFKRLEPERAGKNAVIDIIFTTPILPSRVHLIKNCLNIQKLFIT
jgi:hypothetical protein